MLLAGDSASAETYERSRDACGQHPRDERPRVAGAWPYLSDAGGLSLRPHLPGRRRRSGISISVGQAEVTAQPVGNLVPFGRQAERRDHARALCGIGHDSFVVRAEPETTNGGSIERVAPPEGTRPANELKARIGEANDVLARGGEEQREPDEQKEEGEGRKRSHDTHKQQADADDEPLQDPV